MRVMAVVAALVVLVMAGGVLWAQGEEPVLLQYKFVPGRTVNYEATGNGTMPMSLNTGPEAGNQTIAMHMAMDMRVGIKETCEEVLEDGKGKMLIALPLMITQVSTAVADQAVDALVTWENNRLAVTVNGQPVPGDQNTEQLTTLLKNPLKLIVTPTGAAKLDEETLQLLGDMANNPLSGFSYSLNSLTAGLSEQPVKTGDTWEVIITGEQTNGTLEGSATCKLTGFEEVEGLHCARIEGEAQMRSLKALPNLSVGGQGDSEISAMDLSIRFVNYFAPEAGHMVRSTMDMIQNMSMVVTVGGQGGAQAMRLPAKIENGQMHMEMRYKPAE
ncbi:MAG: hypothetical protein HPY69_17240 [Armatimonadetes bacterium]|nr:hypothetical protein [Armatimonadota bacterium]